VEVKVTTSDFRADFKKRKKHGRLGAGRDCVPRTFCYCCPPGVIPAEDLPPYAGLYHYLPNGRIIPAVEPRVLPAPKITEQELLALARNVTFRFAAQWDTQAP